MFITEHELFKLKYLQKDYAGKCLAEIYLFEYDKVKDKFDVIDTVKHFYHRFSPNFEQCDVRFEDNSILLIEKENGSWNQFTIYHPYHLHIYAQYKFESR